MKGQHERTTLALGGLAALLASTCCLGPLLLLALGVSGAWIGNLTKLEPYRPVALGVALVTLAMGSRIWRPASACAPGDACAVPAVRRSYRILFAVVAALTLLGLAFPYVAPFFY